MGSIIGLTAVATPADGMASIDVPQDGKLVGVDWSVSVAASGADFGMGIEVSFGSTNSLTSNDTRSTISHMAIASDLTTSGAMKTSEVKAVRLPDVPVFAGERIFLHAVGTAITLTARCLLHFSFNTEVPAARRR